MWKIFTSACLQASLIVALCATNLNSAGKVVNVTPEEAATTIAAQASLVIIDLRTPAEYNEGHIEGAININAVSPDFERRLRNNELLKDHDWLVYCRSGNRSKNVLPALRRISNGIIFHLRGGIMAWNKAGYSLSLESALEED